MSGATLAYAGSDASARPGPAPTTGTASTGPGSSAQIRAAGRRRQNPVLMIISVVLILGCAAIFGAVYLQAGDRQSVLVAVRDIPAGHAMTAEDFTSADVAGEGFYGVLYSSRDKYIGSYATSAIPKGSLVTQNHFTTTPTPAAGFVAAAVRLEPGQVPPELASGRHVTVFGLPESRDPARRSQVLVANAEVLGMTPGKHGGGTIVTLACTPAEAERVTAAYNTAALTMLPQVKE